MVQIRKWLIISAIVASMPSLALADVLRHETRYRVSLAGLPIARADFKTEVTGNQFTIRGDITSAGLADLVTSIDAKTDVTGVVNDSKLQATHYTLFYKSGKRERTYDVAYTNGNVTSNTITPEPKRPDTWVPLTGEDLKAVLDPISGMIFPITPSLNLCNQTLAVFDGEMRMDLKLSPKGSHPFSTDGFKGKTIACGVRFTPKSGYKSTRKDYVYLAKSDNMEIWFAKADTMNVYAPVYVRIPTQYGTVTITAVKYGS